MSPTESIKHFSKENIDTRPILLFGAGVYGEIAYQVITKMWNGKVEKIIDNKYSKVAWYDEELIRSSKLEEYPNAKVLICAANAFQSIYEELKTSGDTLEIFDLKEILKVYRDGYKNLFKSSYLYGDIDFDEIYLRYNYYAGDANGYSEKIYLPYCVLCITSKCSLRCENCAAFVTKYKPQHDYSLEYVKKNFGLLLEVIDGIQELELMGGEPFLHSHLDDILSWCIKQDKIHAIKIVTNGTIMPKETTWQVMRHNKVKLVIDDYGKLSKEFEAIITHAKNLGIRYEKQCLQTWYQLEPISKKNFSTKKIKSIFQNCNFKTCIGMTNGRFYHCNVAGHMHTVGLLSDQDSDYVELDNKEWSKPDLRNEIYKLINIEYLNACDYCNYSSNREIPVAKQLPL